MFHRLSARHAPALLRAQSNGAPTPTSVHAPEARVGISARIDEIPNQSQVSARAGNVQSCGYDHRWIIFGDNRNED